MGWKRIVKVTFLNENNSPYKIITHNKETIASVSKRNYKHMILKINYCRIGNFLEFCRCGKNN